MTQRYSHLSPAALVDTVRLLETRPVDSERGDILETKEGRDETIHRGRTAGPASRSSKHAKEACVSARN